VPDQAEEARDLEDWSAFHEALERLPAREREVVSLVFYHHWTQAQIAELFQVTVRTVQQPVAVGARPAPPPSR
jgi:RNA polymerase sigma-70 factor (ECF subfamily)